MSLGEDARIAFVGFGEAAQAFVTGWALPDAGRISAFDVKTDEAGQREQMLDNYSRLGVCGRSDIGAALAGAGVVFCTVTADRALEADKAGAPSLDNGALWLDCNSCAPDTKRSAAEVIEAAGGRYVDVAVMAPVHPRLHRVPLLLSGRDAPSAQEILAALGMKPQIAGNRVGEASAIKMIRSVMIKGFEALTAECFLAARRAGVERQVLESLQASDPGFGFPDRAAYNLERMMVHGPRRAAEMREVAATVAALGLPNAMSEAAAEWQQRIGAARLDGGPDDLATRTDRILAHLSSSAI